MKNNIEINTLIIHIEPIYILLLLFIYKPGTKRQYELKTTKIDILYLKLFADGTKYF